MQNPLINRRVGLTLIAIAILLPICICVVLGVAVLLVGMGDLAGGWVLKRIALAGGIIWAIDLIALLLLLALEILAGPNRSDE